MPSVYVSWNGRCPISARSCRRTHPGGRQAADALFDQNSCKWYGWRLEGGLAEEELFPAEWVEPVGDGLCAFRTCTSSELSSVWPTFIQVKIASALCLRLLDQGSRRRPARTAASWYCSNATECDRFRGPLIQNARSAQTEHSSALFWRSMDGPCAFIRHFHMPELHY